MNEKQDSFKYTYYSAKEQQEIRRIREKYAPPAEGKMEQLRRLDESTERPARRAAIIIGTIGTLLLGVGMCCCTVWAQMLFIPGIAIGLVGIAGMGAACPVYNHIVKKRREKIAPEILRLTDELEGK